MQTAELLLLLLLAPLVAAIIIALFGRQRGNFAALVSIAAAGVIMSVALYLLYGGGWDGETLHVSVSWFTLGSLTIPLGFLLNDVSALMLFVVGFVGFWIHLFSWGYMQDDAAKGRFFGGLSIFMFSMLGIVLADSLFMIFIFWELVGFSSYMLIGHYLQKTTAAAASKKAFIVNRVGDFGFLLGIILTYWTFGTTELTALQAAVGLQEGVLTAALGLLLFCGVLGKSAQMPLHVWLPDAMEGPTPISALIHAATMVAAGVFLLARVFFLFTPEALQVVTWIGLVTAISAAFWAFAQNDIKKILAYSTLSQLGYMVAAFGLGTTYGLAQGGDAVLYGLGAAMFHLTTHAFFKALMFLGSGSVIHAMHHEQDIYQMGGLLRKMPITGVTFLLGVIAIAGIPFISAGFFSKDAILFIAKVQSTPAFVILVITALMTATYMGRLFVIAFLGQARSEAACHAHESPWVMWLPLVVLSVFAVGGGYMILYPEVLHSVLDGAVLHPKGSEKMLMVVISICVGGGGLLLSWLFYGRSTGDTDALAQKAPAVFNASRSRFYFDEVYSAFVAKVQQRLADLLDFLDTLFIGGLLVRGAAGVAGLFGIVARSLHTGSVSTYVWWFFAGLLLFLAYATNVFSLF